MRKVVVANVGLWRGAAEELLYRRAAGSGRYWRGLCRRGTSALACPVCTVDNNASARMRECSIRR